LRKFPNSTTLLMTHGPHPRNARPIGTFHSSVVITPHVALLLQ